MRPWGVRRATRSSRAAGVWGCAAAFGGGEGSGGALGAVVRCCRWSRCSARACSTASPRFNPRALVGRRRGAVTGPFSGARSQARSWTPMEACRPPHPAGTAHSQHRQPLHHREGSGASSIRRSVRRWRDGAGVQLPGQGAAVLPGEGLRPHRRHPGGLGERDLGNVSLARGRAGRARGPATWCARARCSAARTGRRPVTALTAVRGPVVPAARFTACNCGQRPGRSAGPHSRTAGTPHSQVAAPNAEREGPPGN